LKGLRLQADPHAMLPEHTLLKVHLKWPESNEGSRVTRRLHSA
jgi:hypothetical protein